MNVRGRMVIENCKVEAPGDDCINLGAQRENVAAAILVGRGSAGCRARGKAWAGSG
ncbi:MAG: hypothetical protein HN919_20500 [Verrucomicrobia bacterium]|nr:hypothetical protein [Verrucomicrobiota bacterium]